jgi:hypothetical protein
LWRIIGLGLAIAMSNSGANASLPSKSSSKNPAGLRLRPEIVGLRVEFQETELQRRVKQARSKWNSTMRVWEIHYDRAVALGLKTRIVKLEVADVRHFQAPSIGL